jgi:AcrR family transcriptional regulator
MVSRRSPLRVAPEASGRRGRPRSARADEVILAATIEILAERGVRGLNVDVVAARAHAGKDTIYRRWPTRAQLVHDALDRAAAAGVPVPDTGRVEDDLVAYLDEVARFLSDSPFGRIAASVIGAAIDDEALEVAARAFWVERRAIAGSIIERAVARREMLVNGPVDLLVELLVGPIYYRWLVMRAPTDVVRIREIVGLVVGQNLRLDRPPLGGPVEGGSAGCTGAKRRHRKGPP